MNKTADGFGLAKSNESSKKVFFNGFFQQQ
jgi:hypothetical protein